VSRFRPRLEEMETRETPASGFSPQQILQAEYLANLFYSGTHAALVDQSFIRQPANQAGTQATAGVIVLQAPVFENMLGTYVAELQQDQAAGGPQYNEWWQEQIDRFMAAENHARLAVSQAQQVSALITQFQTQSSGSGTNGTGTGTGTTSIGNLGTNPGTSTGTVNTPTTPGTGTTTGAGTGTGTNGGVPNTTGSSGTGTTSTQGSGTTSGTNPTGTTTSGSTA
jgi:hypothetical protein